MLRLLFGSWHLPVASCRLRRRTNPRCFHLAGRRLLPPGAHQLLAGTTSRRFDSALLTKGPR